MTKLSENLKKLMKDREVNPTKLAKEIGVNQSIINRIMHNVTSSPGIATLEPIAHFFSISISELIGDVQFHNSQVSKNTHVLPIISWEEAANWNSLYSVRDLENYKLIETSKEINGFALLMEDDSDLRFPAGTILLIDEKKEPNNKDYVIVNKMDEKTAMFRHYLKDGDTVYLKPLNSVFKTERLGEQHNIIGVVVKSIFNFY